MQALSDRDFELLDEMVATAGGDTRLVAEVLASSDESPLPVSLILERIELLRAARTSRNPDPRLWAYLPLSTARH